MHVASLKTTTLSADEDTIARARAYAQAHGTTLNDLIRDYLAQIAKPLDRDAAADEFIKLARGHSGCSEEGWRFNRVECHRRKS
jgi:hypothetical protein